MNPQFASAAWRKATKSSTNGGCVEVADLGVEVAVRDSKQLDGPVLVFDGQAWDAFIAGVQAGDLTAQ